PAVCARIVDAVVLDSVVHDSRRAALDIDAAAKQIANIAADDIVGDERIAVVEPDAAAVVAATAANDGEAIQCGWDLSAIAERTDHPDNRSKRGGWTDGYDVDGRVLCRPVGARVAAKQVHRLGDIQVEAAGEFGLRVDAGGDFDDVARLCRVDRRLNGGRVS